MKVKTCIPQDVQCRGRIKAEGDKAKVPFCWRPRVLKEDSWGKKTAPEFYSRVTGKLIGYLDPQKNLVTDPQKAETFDQLNTPLIHMHVESFIRDAQSKVPHPNLKEDWKRYRKTLEEIVRKAKGKVKPSRKIDR